MFDLIDWIKSLKSFIEPNKLRSIYAILLFNLRHFDTNEEHLQYRQ